ncbi:hypothetical protein DFQ01_11886 [Paenibacillus cellulosilyticus]|uniref:Uncharacterized protein n=1 Tax=Paenibacillus cellulosilyticus TaxID=375489 RepID=A0A2V2YT52_9BACL|nr:hypothetical protein [Paenibacillus cellulosilyticus]PWV98451.1 hypothetical protein DFQ01_11886 [Paenibacillus cellulosilyticus]QKS43295.1 hypothetical protein HUB94_02145 [Paenibacillus cellulosilyticus]
MSNAMGADRVLLSQWEALLLESLRSLGWSDERLLRDVREGELPVDTSMYEFKYEELRAFATAEPVTFERAVIEGYRIKYNTLRGIRSSIAVAYGLEPELTFEAGEESVTAALTPEQYERLVSVLSYGWIVSEVTKDADGLTNLYRIEPIR